MKPQTELEVIGGPSQAVATTSDNPATNIMAVIARAASDPNVDVAKMERLYAMLEKENARLAEEAFSAAMSECQKMMPPVVREGRNPLTNSHYAKFEHVNEIAKPIYSAQGLSLIFSEGEPISGSNKIRVLCEVRHARGHSTLKHLDLSPDDTGQKGNQSKTKIHGEGSTFTYGRRYLTVLIFNISLINEDDDGNRGRQPKPPGPSSLHGERAPSHDDIANKRKLADLLRHIHRCQGYNLDEAGKRAIEQYLIDEAIITDTETLGGLSGKSLADAVAKVQAKLAAQPK